MKTIPEISKMNLKRVGVISDTHGLLRPEAVAALQGVDLILHAGDVGRMKILDDLQRIAPVVAVRGNVDSGCEWEKLPFTQTFQVDQLWVHLLHDLEQLDFIPGTAGCAMVISGHTHQPGVETRQGVVFLNPGSAGPRRFKLPVTLALIQVGKSGLHPEILPLVS